MKMEKGWQQKKRCMGKRNHWEIDLYVYGLLPFHKDTKVICGKKKNRVFYIWWWHK